ncbi:hypothetical protein KFK09_025983 [Dendrobium nobile]|uniref:Uncharacterized protein n=1 Tax=Dendrobium nobile TaxID=94219 RepID=A0A8T3A6L5_DENNO|nr:hypothetical protein KFK09_025983 [Dendrobium nobile]
MFLNPNVHFPSPKFEFWKLGFYLKVIFFVIVFTNVISNDLRKLLCKDIVRFKKNVGFMNVRISHFDEIFYSNE